MKKVIFTDIDGTLLDGIRGFPYVSEKNLYALKQIKEKGSYIIVSSGRSHSIINKEILEADPDGFILCNGSYIEVGGQVIDKDILKKEVVGRIAECTKACHGLCIYETQEIVGATENDEKLIAMFKSQWNMPSLNIVVREPQDQEIYKMLPAFSCEKDCRDFERLLGNEYEARRQKGVFAYDVTSKNITKGEAVRKVLDHLHMRKEDAIAFGDGVNDIDMLKEAGTGVAVANGDPHLKEYADEVCEDCLDDGFYRWLVRNDIIEEMK